MSVLASVLDSHSTAVNGGECTFFAAALRGASTSDALVEQAGSGLTGTWVKKGHRWSRHMQLAQINLQTRTAAHANC